jgi:hypothetical protein
MAQVFRDASQAIREGRYRPARERQVRRRKRTGGYRVLSLASIAHRSICQAAATAIERPCDAVLHHRVHGCRANHSVLTLLADLEQVVVAEDRWVLVSDDVAAAFPSLPIALVVGSLERIIPDRQLVSFLEMLCRGHNGQEHLVGIEQGSPLSPLLLNVCLGDVLDSPYNEPGTNPPLWRYVDDLVIAATTMAEGERALALLGSFLAQHGLRLKGVGPPIDLRQPGTQVRILGFLVRRGVEGLQLSVDREAWEGLDRDLSDAHRESNAPQHVWDVVRGWLAAWGLAFENAEPVAGRVHQLLARNGFHEGPMATEMAGWIESAKARWETLRRVARSNSLAHQANGPSQGHLAAWRSAPAETPCINPGAGRAAAPDAHPAQPSSLF